jgi:hypothetical protein
MGRWCLTHVAKCLTRALSTLQRKGLPSWGPQEVGITRCVPESHLSALTHEQTSKLPSFASPSRAVFPGSQDFDKNYSGFVVDHD